MTDLRPPAFSRSTLSWQQSVIRAGSVRFIGRGRDILPIGTMPTAAGAAIPTPFEKVFGKDHIGSFPVIVFSLFKWSRV